ncbi:MAG: metallophosphoesterase [Rhodospirillales bacterium]|nr:metallophosphoesterase [Rhodospirillales bacterium]
MSERRSLRVAAVGDLHVTGPGGPSYREIFAEISEVADVLCLCGDLTNVGSIREAEALADQLRSLRIPAAAVLGNHDWESGCVADVVRILERAGLTLLGEEVLVVEGVGFAGAKGFAGGFDARMLSPFGEPEIKAFVAAARNEATMLERALAAVHECERVVVVLHYAPIAATTAGEPAEIVPFLGSSRLAEVIDRFPVSAVFHGHAHHGSFRGATPKGTPVYNVAQTVPKEGGRQYALVEV